MLARDRGSVCNVLVTLSKSEILSRMLSPGVIAIIRAQRVNYVTPLMEALVAGGIVATEITMTTANALAAVKQARQSIGGRALVGVGTVLDAVTCSAALEAGAEFIVTPICRPELVQIAHANDRPIMLGVFTPTEAQIAHEAGADFIKIFPAKTLGPGFIKELRGPLPHLRIVPTGGIDLNNLPDFFCAGCAAVGVGSALVSTQIIENGNWPELTRRADEFVAAAQKARK
jgi:2-dehydro-3-deoxyphosphogluconate aldolase/(4S)-4-hydroxy-2-oxoglutarate aldolase